MIQASATARAAMVEEAAAPSSKVKALNNAILRLHSENQDMGKESQSLKTDLEVGNMICDNFTVYYIRRNFLNGPRIFDLISFHLHII